MELDIILLDKGAIIPTQGSDYASGLDMYALEDTLIAGGDTVLVRTGVSFVIPKGYEIQIRPRSGISLKTKLRIANSPGTVDQDYTGECKIIIDNIGKDSILINKGMRIAQAVLCPVVYPELFVVKERKETTRGEAGFGSTGV